MLVSGKLLFSPSAVSFVASRDIFSSVSRLSKNFCHQPNSSSLKLNLEITDKDHCPKMSGVRGQKVFVIGVGMTKVGEEEEGNTNIATISLRRGINLTLWSL